MIVVPAINATDKGEAAEKMKIALQLTKLIHLDIVDGQFAANTTWGSPDELKQVIAENKELANARFELHLMVADPGKVMESWLVTDVVSRVIVHVESMKDFNFISKTCTQYGAELMLAINPATDPSALGPYKEKISHVQVLGVPPGLPGQEFNKEVINKVKLLRESMPDVKIEVDGGMNLETGKAAREAGADILVSASYLLRSDNPKKAYKQLSNL